jgi:uncharacterized protein (DUF433 family)
MSKCFHDLQKHPVYIEERRDEGKIMSYKDIITIEPGKRGGKPCIRNMIITVYDILSWLGSGMTYDEIIDNYPELTKNDILAALECASIRERNLVVA